jgi:hypothetical protein
MFQLVIIGYAGGEILNKLVDGTYDCHPKLDKTINPIITATIPLMFFIPENNADSDYCLNK